MELSALARLVLALCKFFRTFARRTFAERKALKNPEQEKHSLYSIIEKTLVHLGVEPTRLLSVKERWVLFLESKMVIAEPFTFPHVKTWLNIADVQENLKRMAVQALTQERTNHDIEKVLIESYVTINGETQAIAQDIVRKAVTTIITGTLSGLQDPELGILLKIHSHALHEKIDQLRHTLLPEQQLFLLDQCLHNAHWLTETLSNKTSAKTRLGQALCPGDTGPILQRKNLQSQFCETLSVLPDGGVLIATGTEGNGKSWIVGQYWLSLSLKPLTAFIRAEEIDESFNDISDIVIKGLCRSSQTNAALLAKFWKWQFGLWSEVRNRPVSGILVILDGINQRPSVRWAQFIDRLSEFLQELGGKLIVTSRHHYFTQTVETRLVSSYRVCPVPEWTSDERDEILSLRNINIRGKQLSEKVALSLCNPRMLGIALELFNAEQLQDLKELSVSLMLFEHIKASQRDSYELSAGVFSQRLRRHGQEVLERFKINHNEDIDVFDANLDGVFDGGLHAVADGRFFISLPEDATRYRIDPEGLSLALGLAILDIVNKAARNSKDLDEVMASVIEPVIALDKTSDALFAALTVACLDKEQPEPSGITILVGFTNLQNPDGQLASAFVALARLRPEIFFKACEHLALRKHTFAHHHWIDAALIQSVAYPNSRQKILNAATQWLTWVPSLFPPSLIRSTENGENTGVGIENLQKQRNEKIAKFSLQERKLFDTLIFKDSDSFSTLHLLAFKLLAGTELIPYVDRLVKWCFAHTLIQDHYAPWQEFRDLIAFNVVDWEDIRSHLKMHWNSFVQDESSLTGKWTAINILMATGHSDDAQQAEKFAHQLRDNSLDRKSWHINESWCEADPCNPANLESDNVSITADKHTQLDVSKLYNSFGNGYQESFFYGAATSLARYRPKIATGNYLRLAEDILQRSGMPLRQGIFALLPHRALITPAIAHKLVKRVISTTANDQAAWLTLGKESDLLKQFQLSLAFHQLNAIEQFQVLNKLRLARGLVLSLIETIKPLNWDNIQKHLPQALSTHDTDLQSTLLLFLPRTESLPQWLNNFIPQLLDSPSQDVRDQMLLKVSETSDTQTLRTTVQILMASDRQPESKQEQWYRSVIFFHAIKVNIITWEQRKAQLKYIHSAQLARIYGGAIANSVAEYFDAFLNRALKNNIDVGMLQLTLTLKSVNDRKYTFYQLSEIEVPSQNTDADLAAMFKNNDIESFNKQQRSLQERYKAVRTLLSDHDLSALTDHFYPVDFAALVTANPSHALLWAESLLNEKYTDSLPLVRHIGLVLAQVLSAHHPALSVELFNRLEDVIPFIKVTFTAASIDLSAVAVWSASDSPEITSQRKHRLYKAENNDILAHEIWAALFCQQEKALLEFISELSQSPLPIYQARGIMMAGYLGRNALSESILSKNNYSGLLHKSIERACDAYQRHLWTLHWYSLMHEAISAESFWCASVTFLQVVDERFLMVKHDDGTASDIYMQYWPCVASQLNSRFKKPRRKRTETLFGNKAPWPGFLRRKLGS